MTSRSRRRHERLKLKHRAEQHRRFVEKIKADNGCQDCGGRDNLTFDHRVRSDKHFGVTSRLATSHANFFRELWKCDLVCRSCHDERERCRDRLNARRAGARERSGRR